MLTIVVILFMKKGKIQAYMVSKHPLLLTPDSIKIDTTTYRINEITDLVITIHSYNAMNDPSGSESYNGMRNNISFKYHGAEEYHWFYLRNRQHAIELCAVLREYYRKKIPVTEKDMTGKRTWLMQRLENMQEVEAFKKRHKIP
jgi:hypothetical protein